MTRHQRYTWSFTLYFCWHFLPHRSHFPVARTEMQRRVTGWLHFSVKHYKIFLHPGKHPAVSFPISPLLPLSVPLAQGLAVLAEALCCKSGSACPVINRSELHRSAVQMQVTASCSTSMPRSVLIEQILFCSPLFDPCSVWFWSILSNSFCFTCNKYGDLEIQGIVVYRLAMCVLCSNWLGQVTYVLWTIYFGPEHRC